MKTRMSKIPSYRSRGVNPSRMGQVHLPKCLEVEKRGGSGELGEEVGREGGILLNTRNESSINLC